MDAAWADHDHESVILLGDDVGAFAAAAEHGLEGDLGGSDLVGEQGWRDERVVAEDCS